MVTSTVPCRDCPFLKVSWSGCARCWLRWETWAHNLWEGIVRPGGQRITLLTEWQWMDSPSDRWSSEGEVVRLGASVGNGVENGEEKGVSIKVPRNMDDMGWLLRKTRLQHNSIILSHVHTTKIACVARVECARCGVLFTSLHRRLQGNRYCLWAKSLKNKWTIHVQVFCKKWLMILSLLKRFIL